MSDLGNPKLVASCRIDITGAATAVFLSNSGGFELLAAGATIATLTVPAAGRQIDQVGDTFVASGEGTGFNQPVIERVAANRISVRLFDEDGVIQQGECSIDWYSVARG